MQNTSHAVMAQRVEPADSLDLFPTPPWATRALLEYVIKPLGIGDTREQSFLEPACGYGDMAKVLHESFGSGFSLDVADLGYGWPGDYLKTEMWAADWVITNPPFRLAEQFILKALTEARIGVAMLVRTSFLEGAGRYERLFSKHPPTVVAQFVERVPMLKGRLLRKASTATAYCWLVWDSACQEHTSMVWIPPCRKELERHGDYDDDRRDFCQGARDLAARSAPALCAERQDP